MNNNIQEGIEEKEKETIEKIMNIIEELIHEGIYRTIWINDSTNEDIELNEICKNKLTNLTPADIGIN